MTTCYAAWNRNVEVLKESTSGGVFSALAEQVLSASGIVVGAAYGDGLKVEHRVAHTQSELAALRGVKYVYSEIGKTVWDEIAETLKTNRQVLFVGTPCQAAGVRKRFGSPKNLLVCDLVCFGCPSQDFWLKYVAWEESRAGNRLTYISPRDKLYGWGRKTFYRYEWSDGNVTRECSRYNPYAHAFYTTLSFRPSCFCCPFRGVERVSDLTLCDMWNAGSLQFPASLLRGGVSGVMVHSEHGARAFESAALDRREVPLEIFLEGNSPIVKSPNKPPHWNDFNVDSKAMPFDALVRKYNLKRTRVQYVSQRIMYWIKRLVVSCMPLRLVNLVKDMLRHG